MVIVSRKKTRVGVVFTALVVSAMFFGSGSAQAHFKLEQPVDWLQTDTQGDPLGTNGSQKINPCGAGSKSGLITQVRAGSKLHIKLIETVPHGGHYRIAVIPKYNPTTTDLPEPATTLKAGQCDTAAIQNPVVAPVVADNLFEHTQAAATDNKLWETDVQLPTQTGPATLQIIEFMAPHAPGCFYHHCAQLEVLPPDATIVDGGVVGSPPDGGGGSSGGNPSDGDAGSGNDNGASGTTSGGSKRLSNSNGADEGCNVSDASPSASLVTVGSLALIALSLLIQRRKPRD